MVYLLKYILLITLLCSWNISNTHAKNLNEIKDDVKIKYAFFMPQQETNRVYYPTPQYTKGKRKSVKAIITSDRYTKNKEMSTGSDGMKYNNQTEQQKAASQTDYLKGLKDKKTANVSNGENVPEYQNKYKSYVNDLQDLNEGRNVSEISKSQVQDDLSSMSSDARTVYDREVSERNPKSDFYSTLGSNLDSYQNSN